MRREMEDTNKDQKEYLELKNTWSEMKKLMGGLKGD